MAQNLEVNISQCLANNLGPTASGDRARDGYALIEGDSTAVTFNLGMLFKPRPNAKIGVAYRHGVEHDLEGDAEFENNDAGLVNVLADSGTDWFQNGDVTALAKLPASLMFSGAFQVNDKIELLADATWTQWSVFEELRVKFSDSDQVDSVSRQDWEDVWRFSAGVNYTLSDALTLKAGVAYDQDPVPSVKRRTPRIPGNDRTWLSFGLGYNLNKSIAFDVGYALLMVDESSIDNGGDTAVASTIRGNYDSSINILGAQLNWRFN